VAILRRVREQIGVAIGDLLDARAIKGKIVFKPKSIVDRGIAEALEGRRSHEGVPNTERRTCEALEACNLVTDGSRFYRAV
jgi:hypothetical protein